MNGSYKIAFFLAIGLCAAIIGFSIYQGQPETSDDPPSGTSDRLPIVDPPAPTLPSNSPTLTAKSDPDKPAGRDRIRRLVLEAQPKQSPDQEVASDRQARTPDAARQRVFGRKRPSLLQRQNLVAKPKDEPPPTISNKPSMPSLAATAMIKPSRHTSKPALAKPGLIEHTIRSGDTLGKLAAKYYGHEKYWPVIAKANPKITPRTLRIGQVIMLPKSPRSIAQSKTNKVPAQPLPKGTRVHVVGEGDSLWAIARRYYQSGDQWRTIFDANRDTIGSRPGNLRLGMRLRIPPRQ